MEHKYFNFFAKGDYKVLLTSVKDIDGKEFLKEPVRCNYDPKTKTITCNVKLPDNARRPFKVTFTVDARFYDIIDAYY